MPDSSPALSDSDATLYAFRRNVVVAASAGTGKTHRLTTLYTLCTLGLTSMGKPDAETACPPVAPEHIVATTFSRAAAREIRARVERALCALGDDEGVARGTPVGEAVWARAERLGIDSWSLIRERAETALRSLHAASIDTLHATAGAIVRGNALDLGVPPDVRLLDEDEAREVTHAAVDEALGEALALGADQAQAARALVAACAGVPNTREAIGRLLDRADEEGLAVEELTLEDHLSHARTQRAALIHQIESTARSDQSTQREVAQRVLDTLCARGDDVRLGEAGAEALGELMALRRPHKTKRTDADESMHDFFGALAGKNKKEKHQRLVAFLDAAPDLAAREREIVQLLVRARLRLAEHKRRAGGIGFGDVLRLARHGLCQDPAISRTARRDVRVMLVDEFQDTSSVQRDLVYLLREDDASSRAPGDEPRPQHLTESGLFLVGDRKQSIYGFRGADVAVFSRVCVELCGEQAARALNLSVPDDPTSRADFIALSESRRSGANILSFVNTFCAADFASGRDTSEAPRDFEVEYAEAERLAPVHGAPTDSDSAGEVVILRDDLETPPDAEPLIHEARGAARESFVAGGFVARLAEREAVPFRDIAVLTRRRSTIPLVELALGRLGVPYVVAGRALFAASEIRDVAAVLRLVLDPHDRHSMATVLRGPVVALSDRALLSLSDPQRGLSAEVSSPRWSLEQAAFPLPPDDAAALTSFRRRFATLRPALLRMAPADTLRVVVQALDLDRVIAALPRGPARLGNVDRLVDVARRRGGTLAGFSRWLDRQIADDTDEPEAVVFSAEDDAVRLTTIHGSKGLDFPVVVLADLDATTGPAQIPLGLTPRTREHPATFVCRHYGPSGTLVPTEAMSRAQAELTARERAERRRLTYVALTRARRMLVLVAPTAAARRHSALATLQEGLEGDLAGSITRTELAASLLSPPRGASPCPEPTTPDVRGTTVAIPRHTVTIATTPLSIFRGCERRFRLRFLMGLDEPVESGQLDLFDTPTEPGDEREPRDDGDPREAGRAAHRLLERWPWALWGESVPPEEVLAELVSEGLPHSAQTTALARGVARFLGGAYARSLRTEGATITRERAFVCSTSGDSALSLRGAMDLVARFPDGSIDVIDYKHARARKDLAPYDFQLRAYAWVMATRAPGAGVRAGALFLGDAEEPVMLPGDAEGGALSAAQHQAFERELQRLGARLSEARAEGRWSAQPLEQCRALRCGFVTACHRDRGTKPRI